MDIKEIIHKLQNEGILTLGYKRGADILKLVVITTDWVDNDRLADWLTDFLNRTGIEVDAGALTATNLGPDYHGTAYTVMFPLTGKSVPYTKLV